MIGRTWTMGQLNTIVFKREAEGSFWQTCLGGRASWSKGFQSESAGHDVVNEVYARMFLTTWASSTPVRRWLKPRNLKVKRSWSMPIWCNTVALRSRMWTGSSRML